ncbi:hypothetical protein [Halorussus ruber]|uniref:hypothetical protein n=1 Tax=Halorussus ruber TaxID=1126238 RepID=UPI0010925148|nr:hypothetical protein [Halorussus ruber]
MTVHPLVADTDALIAYARLDCWDVFSRHQNITTTNKCESELHTHKQSGEKDFATEEEESKGDAADRVLDALDTEESPMNVEFCGGSTRFDTGEESIKVLVEKNARDIDGILLMDSGDEELYEGGRAYLTRTLDLDVLNVGLLSLGVPVALLRQSGYISEETACAAIDDISEKEGWTSRKTLKHLWDEVPLNCDEKPSFCR